MRSNELIPAAARQDRDISRRETVRQLNPASVRGGEDLICHNVRHVRVVMQVSGRKNVYESPRAARCLIPVLPLLATP